MNDFNLIKKSKSHKVITVFNSDVIFLKYFPMFLLIQRVHKIFVIIYRHRRIFPYDYFK